MDSEYSIPDKILHLKSIPIFEGLAVRELAAVATVTKEVDVESGQTVIKEGEAGNDMYLILEGEVAVSKAQQDNAEQEFELAHIKAGDYFGEMSLFEDEPRSATIRTVKDSRFLVLQENEFAEIVTEYPQITLHICRAFCQRIRELHVKIDSYEKR